MKSFPLLALALLPGLAMAEASGAKCSAEAVTRARALLEFHLGESEQVLVGDTAKPLPALRNPKNPKQWLDVLEVRGSFYKGEYRMRLIYARLPGDTCALIGEEVLQFATL